MNTLTSDIFRHILKMTVVRLYNKTSFSEKQNQHKELDSSHKTFQVSRNLFLLPYENEKS